jgi:hypothetical protein
VNKPWEQSDWAMLSWTDKWKSLEAYLKAHPGCKIKGSELCPFDQEFADAIDSEGGVVWCCEHGTIHFPCRPCDLCWHGSCVGDDAPRQDCEG